MEGSLRLGRAVKAVRIARGLKRKDLAESAGLSYSYVSEIEQGKKDPSTRALLGLANALGVRAYELLASAESFTVAKHDRERLNTGFEPSGLRQSQQADDREGSTHVSFWADQEPRRVVLTDHYSLEENRVEQDQRFTELLLENDLITEDQLREALDEQSKVGGSLNRIVVEMGFVADSDLWAILLKLFAEINAYTDRVAMPYRAVDEVNGPRNDQPALEELREKVSRALTELPEEDLRLVASLVRRLRRRQG